MFAALQGILQSILVFLGRLISSLFISVSVSGLEHFPRNEGLILVSNHFSWFDGPLLMIFLPVRIVFLLAIETERVCFFRFLSRVVQSDPDLARAGGSQGDARGSGRSEGGPDSRRLP